MQGAVTEKQNKGCGYDDSVSPAAQMCGTCTQVSKIWSSAKLDSVFGTAGSAAGISSLPVIPSQ